MSDETLELVIKRAYEYAEGSLYLSFQGGEPALAGKEFFKRVVELEAKYNLKKIPTVNAIQTNGSLLDDEFCDLLAECGFLVGVSLDGTALLHDAHRGKGSYLEARTAIERLAHRGVISNVLAVVTKEMTRASAEVYESLREFSYLQFTPVLPLTKDELAPSVEDYADFLCKIFDSYYRDALLATPKSIRLFDGFVRTLAGLPQESCARREGCGFSPVVEADGAVYPCDFFAEDKYLLGNIREASFADMEKGQIASRFVARSLEIAEDCRRCRYYSLCRGGCYRERSSKGLDRYCESYKHFFEASFSKMVMLARALQS